MKTVFFFLSASYIFVHLFFSEHELSIHVCYMLSPDRLSVCRL